MTSALLLHSQIFEILAKTPYGHEKKGLFGVDQLLSQGIFRAAFPLHDVRHGGWRAWAWGELLDKGALLSTPRGCGGGGELCPCAGGCAGGQRHTCHVTRPHYSLSETMDSQMLPSWPRDRPGGCLPGRLPLWPRQ